MVSQADHFHPSTPPPASQTASLLLPSTPQAASQPASLLLPSTPQTASQPASQPASLLLTSTPQTASQPASLLFPSTPQAASQPSYSRRRPRQPPNPPPKPASLLLPLPPPPASQPTSQPASLLLPSTPQAALPRADDVRPLICSTSSVCVNDPFASIITGFDKDDDVSDECSLSDEAADDKKSIFVAAPTKLSKPWSGDDLDHISRTASSDINDVFYANLVNKIVKGTSQPLEFV